MPKDDRYNHSLPPGSHNNTTHGEEARSLLSIAHDDEDDIIDTDDIPPPVPPKDPPRRATSRKRQSSILASSNKGLPRTPRTQNRVRFAEQHQMVAASNGHVMNSRAWSAHDDDDDDAEQDYLTSHATGHAHHSQRAPLLTDIEAPSVSVATADFVPEDYLESARPKSNMRSAFMNMANSIIGAGIIGQPYALRQAGLLTGIVLLIALTIVVDWTIRLIVLNSKLSGADSFQTTVQYCFGKPGLIAISLAQWAFAFGGMLAFCIIVGDTIPKVMTALFPSLPSTPFLWLLTDRRAIIVLFILGLSFPLSLYRDIAKLAKASTLALVSMAIIVIAVITQGAQVPAEMKGDLSGHLIISDGFFQAIGVISFAFVCHHNSLLIYGSLQKPTMDRFARVTHYSTGVSMLACAIMALSGFLTFGSETKGNILNNFPYDNTMVNIARFCLGLNMLTTLPLECFVCREVLETYFFPTSAYSPNRHILLTTALVVSAMLLSLLTCDLGAVFEIIGATSACMLAYILPPMCFIKLSRKGWSDKAPAYVCIVFGVGVMVISLGMSIRRIVSGEGGSKTC